MRLSLIGDRRMRRLNRRFRGKDRRTDVLAFAIREARCPASVRWPPIGRRRDFFSDRLRQAKEASRSLDEEIVTLLIHGVLHLCGYDHERNRRKPCACTEEWQMGPLGKIPLPGSGEPVKSSRRIEEKSSAWDGFNGSTKD